MPVRKTLIQNRYLVIFSYAVFLLALTLIVYYPVLDNFFLGDDAGWIYRGSLLKVYPKSLFQTIAGKFRPLILVVFLLEYKMFSFYPRFYYLTNLLVHFSNALLVFFFTFMLMSRLRHENALRIALSCSFIFTFLFMNYETLLWISLVHDLLNTFFYLLTLILFFKFYMTQKTLYYIPSLLCYSLSLCTKEISVMAPFVLFLILVLVFHEKKISIYAFLIPYLLIPLPFFLSVQLFKNMSLFSFGFNIPAITFSYLHEALFSTFGFSKNIALQLLINTPSLRIIMNTLRIVNIFFLFLMSLLFVMGMRKKYIDSVMLGRTFLLCFLWCGITFLPYSMVPTASKSTWLLFSPGYHYFYISSLGVALFISFLLIETYTMHAPRFSLPALARPCMFVLTLMCLFFSNTIPFRLMEKAYAYHGEILRHLLATIHNTYRDSENTKELILVDFPQEYIDIHSHGLPKYIELMRLPFYERTIHWVSRKSISSSMTHALCLQYINPFHIKKIKC